jgi:hypothetical protein
MNDVIEAIGKLREYAEKLDELSDALTRVERDLEPVAEQYEAFMLDFEVGLWKRHEDEGAKLPSAAMRVKLAHKAMDPALLGRYVGLTTARKRGQEKIRAVKASAEAQRSILSALKETAA